MAAQNRFEMAKALQTRPIFSKLSQLEKNRKYQIFKIEQKNTRIGANWVLFLEQNLQIFANTFIANILDKTFRANDTVFDDHRAIGYIIPAETQHGPRYSFTPVDFHINGEIIANYEIRWFSFFHAKTFSKAYFNHIVKFRFVLQQPRDNSASAR